MKYHCVLFGLLLASLLGTSQQAPPQPPAVDIVSSGSAFISRCDPAPDAWIDGFCRGYVSGLSEPGPLLVAAPNCPPKGVTYGQDYLIVVKYIHNHPEEMHKQTSVLVLEALREAFPCPAKKS
jgi:hypothetical protein